MTNPTINPELVAQITTRVQAWTVADRRIRALFHGWEQRAARAGVERGFYTQLGTLPNTSTLCDEEDDSEAAGRHLYAAYLRGGLMANLDRTTR
jgi:hypothetical protein